MNYIASVFHRKGHPALIPYVTVGYPSLEATRKIVPLLARCGSDMVELGIPFSDPLADGAMIQKASYYALKNGVTPHLCLETAEQLSREVDIPLLFMTYFNPVYSYGTATFCRDCARCGVSGLIIPDLPPEEAVELEATTGEYNIDLVYLLSPASTEKRIRLVAERSKGFIYLVSVSGVTGTRDTLPQDLGDFIARVKKVTGKPICVGFGISTAEQARQVVNMADGVIVGSRIIQLMEADNSLEAVRDFVTGVRNSLDQP